MDEREFPAAVWDAAPRRVRYGAGTAATILARVAAGESMRAICRDPSMPAPHTVGRWVREKASFAADLWAARVASGQPLRPGGRSTYCVATAGAILERMWAGEAVTVICRDPEMPVAATVYKWRQERPEFAKAFAAAFELRAEGLFERGWELACAVTPETAYATDVKLRHLRWFVGKLSPKKYGPQKAVAPAQQPSEMNVWTKNYILPTAEESAAGQSGRWSQEPSVHAYSMVPVDDPTPAAGMALPKPAYVREPATCRGPDATYAPRGGAIEVEVEGEEEDDYWAQGQRGAGWSGEDLT